MSCPHTQSHKVYVRIIILSSEFHLILCPDNINDFYLNFLESYYYQKRAVEITFHRFSWLKKQIYSKLFFCVLCCQNLWICEIRSILKCQHRATHIQFGYWRCHSNWLPRKNNNWCYLKNLHLSAVACWDGNWHPAVDVIKAIEKLNRSWGDCLREGPSLVLLVIMGRLPLVQSKSGKSGCIIACNYVLQEDRADKFYFHLLNKNIPSHCDINVIRASSGTSMLRIWSSVLQVEPGCRNYTAEYSKRREQIPVQNFKQNLLEWRYEFFRVWGSLNRM